jgi:hypothetical protein
VSFAEETYGAPPPKLTQEDLLSQFESFADETWGHHWGKMRVMAAVQLRIRTIYDVLDNNCAWIKNEQQLRTSLMTTYIAKIYPWIMRHVFTINLQPY